MNIKSLVLSILETVIAVAVIVVAVNYIIRFSTQAYDFGYRIFAEDAVSAEGYGRIITVEITEEMSVEEIGEMLADRGLIEDANLFVVQELLSGDHGHIVPGVYDLSTEMTAAEMIEVMCESYGEEEEMSEDTEEADG